MSISIRFLSGALLERFETSSGAGENELVLSKDHAGIRIISLRAAPGTTLQTRLAVERESEAALDLRRPAWDALLNHVQRNRS